MRLSQEDSQLRQATEVASAAPWILALPALLNFTSLFILYDFFFSFCILVLFLLIPPAANSLSFNNLHLHFHLSYLTRLHSADFLTALSHKLAICSEV